jgi:cytochrome bd-type quinol oxidase subunit 2
MDGRGLRNASRRLVIELAVVVLLVGFPVHFPRGTSSGDAWSFLVRHPTVLLHVVVGTLILVEGVRFLLLSLRAPARRSLLVAAVGLLLTVFAFGSGISYVSAGQHDSSLTAMSTGWLGAILTYGVGWWLARRALAGQVRSKR